MNCKQAEKLLPLYVGRDLDEKRIGVVSEHLQTCVACACVASEYRDAFQLTQQFAPPVFSDGVYAGIRRNVLKEIETESAGPVMPQLFVGWLRPRMTWAVAIALVVVFTVFAFYFVANRDTANNRAKDVRSESNQSPAAPATATTTTATSATSGTHPRWQSKHGNIHKSGRPAIVAAKIQNSRSPVKISRNLRKSAEENSFPVNDSVLQERTLRVEIQTRDPNIRIIWFSQPNPKPALPNLKGS